MSYDYDPELEPLLDLLPDTRLDISDPVTSRAGFREFNGGPNTISIKH